jgi:hypothetical protein
VTSIAAWTCGRGVHRIGIRKMSTQVQTNPYWWENVRTVVKGGPGNGWPAFIATLAGTGPMVFVKNFDAQIQALVIDNLVLPVTVNGGREDTCFASSPTEFYVSTTFRGSVRRCSELSRRALNATALQSFANSNSSECAQAGSAQAGRASLWPL